jgi:translation initiation factor IF-2
MATVRVHELAKELNLSSKDTIALLGKVGIRASTHMSPIDEHRARIVKGVLRGDLAEAAKTHKAAPKKSVAGGNGAAVKVEAVPEAPPTTAVLETKPVAIAEPPEGPVLKPVPPRQKAPSTPPHHHHKVVPAASADQTAPIPSLKKHVCTFLIDLGTIARNIVFTSIDVTH